MLCISPSTIYGGLQMLPIIGTGDHRLLVLMLSLCLPAPFWVGFAYGMLYGMFSANSSVRRLYFQQFHMRWSFSVKQYTDAWIPYMLVYILTPSYSMCWYMYCNVWYNAGNAHMIDLSALPDSQASNWTQRQHHMLQAYYAGPTRIKDAPVSSTQWNAHAPTRSGWGWRWV